MKLYNKFIIFLSIKEVDLCTKLIFILTAMEKAQYLIILWLFLKATKKMIELF
ncbi:hypothetical protein HMPREF0623_1055 [Pediococcus acidilactici DSM 20284]|uniref:Uncharacterized protein n=1 Tax=Pediococcus acidilactici DSM 20284 TaxID=862514 RepID=E0NGK8_PEDAC|nr:hypothetical protein HMPREF0623_1055 [Pediococcus acidilactici DSM 20284]